MIHSLEYVKKLVKQAKELGAAEIVLTGGEPFLREDLVDIVKTISDEDLKTLIATNGSEVTPAFLGQIQKYEGVAIQVSLDSLDIKINDELREPGAYSAAMNAINLCKKYHVPLQISTTLTAKNVAGIQDLVDYFPDDKIKLRRLVREGLAESRPDLFVKEEDLIRIIQGIVLNSKYRGRVAAEQIPYVFDCDGGPDVYRCSAGNSIAFLRFNGDVTPCPSANFVVGNLDKESLKDIWEKNFDSFRDEQYRPFGYCGRNALVSAPRGFNVPHKIMDLNEFQTYGCKCTG